MSDPHNLMLYLVAGILVLFSTISFSLVLSSLIKNKKDNLRFYTIIFVCFAVSVFIFLKLMK